MYNHDVECSAPLMPALLLGQPQLTDLRRLDDQLFARVFEATEGGCLREIDDCDYLPIFVCMAKFGPADWRIAHPFWFGGVAREGLSVGIYDMRDELLLAGRLPALFQNGRTAEAERYAVWFAGDRDLGSRSIESWSPCLSLPA